MSNDLPALSPRDEVWHAANLMVDRTTPVLPVVENGRLLGLFTLDDFARESPALAAVVFCKTSKIQSAKKTPVWC